MEDWIEVDARIGSVVIAIDELEEAQKKAESVEVYERIGKVIGRLSREVAILNQIVEKNIKNGWVH